MKFSKKDRKLGNLEKQLVAREESTEKKFELFLKKEKETKQLEKDLLEHKKLADQKIVEIKKLEEEQNLRLEKISGLTSEEAKKDAC
jgi:ribonucrease Y